MDRRTQLSRRRLHRRVIYAERPCPRHLQKRFFMALHRSVPKDNKGRVSDRPDHRYRQWIKSVAKRAAESWRRQNKCPSPYRPPRTSGVDSDPFRICDTDVIFYKPVEDWRFSTGISGYLIPEFKDEYTQLVTRSRLHTSLMYIDPYEVKRELDAFKETFRETNFNPVGNLIAPAVIPHHIPYFYDTTSMLYHAIGGTEFTPAQKDAYFHFHFGTFSDRVIPELKDGAMIEATRKMILSDHSLGQGMWRVQDEYFASRQFAANGTSVIADITSQDAVEAVKWNTELCLGDRSAMAFCDMWYRYCHGIDDLIDTLRDGRPRMSKDQMISLFFHAALIYNSDFFIRNREMLFPIVMQVTNTYRDSVEWEHASRAHMRLMADVFRTCGNEMYVIVALTVS